MDKDQMHVDQIKELLKNHKKEAILLRPLDEDLVEEKEAIERCKKKKGCSKFEGCPDVPIDFKWPCTIDHFGEFVPLNFIAQIDLKDASRYDKTGLLPKEGYLYFFMASTFYSMDISEKDGIKVYYYNVREEDLYTIEPPEDSEMSFWADLNHSIYVKFESHDSYPEDLEGKELEKVLAGYPVDKQTYFGGDYISHFLKARIELGDGWVIHEMLGYPQLLQFQDEDRWEQIYCQLYGPQVGERKGEDEWLLLLQYAHSPNKEHYYFYIRKSDLRAGRFNRVWATTQWD